MYLKRPLPWDDGELRWYHGISIFSSSVFFIGMQRTFVFFIPKFVPNKNKERMIKMAQNYYQKENETMPV